jgi:hypothetical protein
MIQANHIHLVNYALILQIYVLIGFVDLRNILVQVLLMLYLFD